MNKCFLFDHMHRTLSVKESNLNEGRLSILLNRWKEDVHSIDYQSYVDYQINGELDSKYECYRIIDFDLTRYSLNE